MDQLRKERGRTLIPSKDHVCVLPVLFRMPPQDPIHKSWHLYWKCGKVARKDREQQVIGKSSLTYNNKAAKLKLKEKSEKDVTNCKSKESLMAQRVPLKLPGKRWTRKTKMTRRNRRRWRKRRRRRRKGNKKTVYLLSVNASE